ncbi:MAG: nodulation protein NfeD, partial [Acidobacteriaceae bacterium]|nr:nodulation protein NfeD [Acidobacteriaceae bacterium]
MPGVPGGIIVLLAVCAISVLTINWFGVALLIIAIAFFVLEAKFAPHGVLAAAGVAAMIAGSLLVIEGPPEMRIPMSTAVGIALPFAVIAVFLSSLVLRTRKEKPITGTAAMQSEIGTAVTALSPSGKVFVRGEYWNAVSATPVTPGT